MTTNLSEKINSYAKKNFKALTIVSRLILLVGVVMSAIFYLYPEIRIDRIFSMVYINIIILYVVTAFMRYDNEN